VIANNLFIDGAFFLSSFLRKIMQWSPPHSVFSSNFHFSKKK